RWRRRSEYWRPSLRRIPASRWLILGETRSLNRLRASRHERGVRVGFASSSLALPSADQMVAGVAGRRFLIEMAAKSSAEAHSAVFDMGLALCHGSTGGLERFERDLLRAIDAAQLPREQTEIRAALWRSIQEAVYW